MSAVRCVSASTPSGIAFDITQAILLVMSLCYIQGLQMQPLHARKKLRTSSQIRLTTSEHTPDDPAILRTTQKSLTE